MLKYCHPERHAQASGGKFPSTFLPTEEEMHLTSSYRAAVAISEIIYRLLAPKPSTMARFDIEGTGLDERLRERHTSRNFTVSVGVTNLPMIEFSITLRGEYLGVPCWNSAEVTAETLTHPDQKFRFTAEFVDGEWKVEQAAPSVCHVEVRGHEASEERVPATISR